MALVLNDPGVRQDAGISQIMQSMIAKGQTAKLDRSEVGKGRLEQLKQMAAQKGVSLEYMLRDPAMKEDIFGALVGITGNRKQAEQMFGSLTGSVGTPVQKLNEFFQDESNRVWGSGDNPYDTSSQKTQSVPGQASTESFRVNTTAGDLRDMGLEEDKFFSSIAENLGMEGMKDGTWSADAKGMWDNISMGLTGKPWYGEGGTRSLNTAADPQAGQRALLEELRKGKTINQEHLDKPLTGADRANQIGPAQQKLNATLGSFMAGVFNNTNEAVKDAGNKLSSWFNNFTSRTDEEGLSGEQLKVNQNSLAVMSANLPEASKKVLQEFSDPADLFNAFIDDSGKTSEAERIRLRGIMREIMATSPNIDRENPNLALALRELSNIPITTDELKSLVGPNGQYPTKADVTAAASEKIKQEVLSRNQGNGAALRGIGREAEIKPEFANAAEELAAKGQTSSYADSDAEAYSSAGSDFDAFKVPTPDNEAGVVNSGNSDFDWFSPQGSGFNVPDDQAFNFGSSGKAGTEATTKEVTTVQKGILSQMEDIRNKIETQGGILGRQSNASSLPVEAQEADIAYKQALTMQALASLQGKAKDDPRLAPLIKTQMETYQQYATETVKDLKDRIDSEQDMREYTRGQDAFIDSMSELGYDVKVEDVEKGRWLFPDLKMKKIVGISQNAQGSGGFTDGAAFMKQYE